MKIKLFTTIIAVLLLTAGCTRQSPEKQEMQESLQTLAEQFEAPPMKYRAHVWWHWMGSNFTKEGITKDLEAMKETGIGGATIFNIASSVQDTHAPMENNPWPHQTYRGEAYWDAFKHTMAEAKRLGLTMGLHGTPGYSTTGGPWIPEERGMQTLVFSQVKVSGNRLIVFNPEKPKLPQYMYKWKAIGIEGEEPGGQATYYRDITLMAIPGKKDVKPSEIMDISEHMDSAGMLRWQAPAGVWHICRIGHAPTMAHPHPLPDDIIGQSLEVDKMSREDNIFHWQQLLEPLKKHVGEYIGNTFTYIWVDSYESGPQDWTPKFREEFTRLKGYDPLPWIMAGKFSENEEEFKQFQQDNKEVISRLFIDNGWKTAREMLHEYDLKLYWEPYTGPFDIVESIPLADMPIDEFWTHETKIRHKKTIPPVAARHGKNIIGAEAFTGRPLYSRYTEDPAFLKHSADGGYASGANLYFLHCWVHQPFDDRYQPGMSMGWWGTHFGRHQTWFKPGKAFFTYLARCQMLLQQGVFVPSELPNTAHRTSPDAEIFFVTNPDSVAWTKIFSFPVQASAPELWDPYKGTIRETGRWEANGDSTYVVLKLEADESVFVVFPKNPTCTYEKRRLPAMDFVSEHVFGELSGPWKIVFQPKLDSSFTREFPQLIDFSRQSDTAVKYFAGTASYEKTIHINEGYIGKNKQILIDLGLLHDIAELEVNGKNAGVLWCPPYKADITPWLKTGENRITIHITNNWANRLIGDEQYPADFEWGTDRGEQGRAMKAFPDWFIKNEARPSQGRKGFTIWYYFREDSPLYPAGLLGPVKLIMQTTKQ